MSLLQITCSTNLLRARKLDLISKVLHRRGNEPPPTLQSTKFDPTFFEVPPVQVTSTTGPVTAQSELDFAASFEALKTMFLVSTLRYPRSLTTGIGSRDSRALLSLQTVHQTYRSIPNWSIRYVVNPCISPKHRRGTTHVHCVDVIRIGALCSVFDSSRQRPFIHCSIHQSEVITFTGTHLSTSTVCQQEGKVLLHTCASSTLILYTRRPLPRVLY